VCWGWLEMCCEERGAREGDDSCACVCWMSGERERGVCCEERGARERTTACVIGRGVCVVERDSVLLGWQEGTVSVARREEGERGRQLCRTTVFVREGREREDDVCVVGGRCVL
jgi:hypothetical protein